MFASACALQECAMSERGLYSKGGNIWHHHGNSRGSLLRGTLKEVKWGGGGGFSRLGRAAKFFPIYDVVIGDKALT